MGHAQTRQTKATARAAAHEHGDESDVNNIKIIIAFIAGGIIGVVGGGFVGYTIGGSNTAIDRAEGATVVEVQEERRPVRPEPPVDAAAVEAAGDPEEAPDVVPEPAPVEVTEEYVISPNMESEIMWVGYKTILGQRISMEGGFANFNGTLVVVNDDPNESYVEVIVDMNTIFSQNSILTGVLRGNAFFDVEEHSTARFASTKIESADEEGRYLVTGNFTLRGETKGIQFPATIERRGDDVFAQAEFTIDRQLWDIGYDMYEGAQILPEVVVSFAILAESEN